MSICDSSSGAKLKVEYSADESLPWNDPGHTWVAVTDVVGRLNPAGGDLSVEEYKTFGTTEVGVDSPGMVNIELDVVFKNGTTSFLEFITDEWEAETCFYIRWAYNEGAGGALRRTALVRLTTNPFTGGAANSAAPVVKSLTFVTAKINRDTVP
ncbi:MAG: hypothetical protein L0332_06840 [Chloroflexi bacterium]|nr:hypothetical protein [Chloroflexota bacterium]